MAGKPLMDEPVGGNSTVRVPVNLACGSEFLSLLGYLLCSALTACSRLYILHTLCLSLLLASQSSICELVSWTARDDYRPMCRYASVTIKSYNKVYH